MNTENSQKHPPTPALTLVLGLEGALTSNTLPPTASGLSAPGEALGTWAGRVPVGSLGSEDRERGVSGSFRWVWSLSLGSLWEAWPGRLRARVEAPGAVGWRPPG